MSALQGSVVATTRAREPDDPFVRALEREGAHVITWPTLAFQEPPDPSPMTRAFERVEDFDWIAFTSPRAVDAALRLAPRPPSRPKVAAVGPSTAGHLSGSGWPVHVQGRGGVAELASLLTTSESMAGARVLFPAGSLASRQLEEALTGEGALVERVEAYRTRVVPPDPAAVCADLDVGVDVVTFASPSAVRSLEEALGERWAELLRLCSVAAIGPTTRDALHRQGANPGRVHTAPTPDPAGMLQAVRRALADVDVRPTVEHP